MGQKEINGALKEEEHIMNQRKEKIMERKILVVGGVAGGASAAARVRRLDAHARIVMFERGEHVSFSNCCLPYHLSGTVENSDALVLMSPEKFAKQHDIEARVWSEVTEIHPREKKVTVRNLQSGECYEEEYDKLILAPGASPVMQEGIVGIRQRHVFSIRNVADIRALKKYIDQNHVRKAAVVGGGFIGVETAENLKMAGLSVTLVEGSSQIMLPFDYDMVQILHKEMLDCGIELYLSGTLKEIKEDWDYTTKGLACICKDGVDSITSALKELENHGYLIRQRIRYENGRLGDITYTIHEKPVVQGTEENLPKRENPRQVKPIQEKSVQENPGQENTAQLNTNLLNTDRSKTYQSIYPEKPEELETPAQQDGIDKIGLADAYREIICENIEYSILVERYGKQRMDEAVELMLEVVLSQRPYIRIAGDDFPRAVVRSRFLLRSLFVKINSSHL